MKTAAIVKKNYRWTLVLLAGSAALALTAMGEEIRPATQPATLPAAQPAPPPALQPMDSSYNVLLTFSIFSKDHKPAPVAIPAPTTRSTDPVVVLGEANYILRGVGVADGKPTAFFELTSDQKITTIHLGDPLLHGIITAGSLDGVDYVVDGKVSHIMIGQALDGGLAVISTTTPSDPNSATHKWAHSHHQD